MPNLEKELEVGKMMDSGFHHRKICQFSTTALPSILFKDLSVIIYLNKYKKEAYTIKPFGNYLPLSFPFVGKYGVIKTDSQ